MIAANFLEEWEMGRETVGNANIMFMADTSQSVDYHIQLPTQ